MKAIKYFDNCATTRVDDEVQKIISRYNTELYYNPSALAQVSVSVQKDMDDARNIIAKALGVTANELYFTSGGTEADNLAITGSVRNRRDCNVVVSKTEHSAVMNTVKSLKEKGVEIRYAKSTFDGHIDNEHYLSLIDQNTALAIMMHVNNETGAVNDIENLNSAVKAINSKTLTFCDGVQAVGKIPVNIRKLGVDLYSFSAHKIHGTKGCGALFVKRNITLAPVLYGGGQEKGLRSGTENVPAIIAFAKAVELAIGNLGENTQSFLHYKEILHKYLESVPCVHYNCIDNCAPHILSLAFKGVKGEILLHMLEDNGFVVGVSSACSSHSGIGRVFNEINLDKQYIEGVLRISFSKYNTLEEVQELGKILAEKVSELRKITGVKL